MNNQLKILAIGTLPPPFGGTSVLFQQLINSIYTNKSIDVRVINTSGIRGSNKLLALFRLLILSFRLIVYTFRVDVVTLHCSPIAIAFLGPVVLATSKIAKKPLIIRKFNGIDYMDLGRVKGGIAHFVIRHANLYLAETKRLVNRAKELGLENVRWYPNSRPMPNTAKHPPVDEKCCQKFVFVGRVDASKGVLEILEIDKQLPPSVTIDIYGPFSGSITKNEFKSCLNVSYRGILPPCEVIATLSRYGALLLPTYHSGEGYPGVIIEAYAAGIPVICTRWLQLPEIVDGTSGLLIPPKDPIALLRAILQLVNNDELYNRLRVGAWRKRKEFSSEYWTECFVHYCKELKNKPIGKKPQ